MLLPRPVAPPVTRILLPASRFFSNTVSVLLLTECRNLWNVETSYTGARCARQFQLRLRLVNYPFLALQPAEDRALSPTFPTMPPCAGERFVPGLFGPPFSGRVQRAAVPQNVVPALL